MQRCRAKRVVLISPSSTCRRCESAVDRFVWGGVPTERRDDTKDLTFPAQMCDRIMVKGRAQIMEEGIAPEIFLCLKLEYAQTLVAAIPGSRMSVHPIARMTCLARPKTKTTGVIQ